MKTGGYIATILASLALAASTASLAGPLGENGNRPITLVVPSSPGSSSDLVARILGRAVTEKVGNPVVVENRPGANGIIGVQNILTRPADGSALLSTTSSPVVFNKFLFKKLPYDPQTELIPLVIFARGTMMLGTTPKLPYSNLAGLIADAKQHPEKLNFGYATATQQLVGELFQKSSGTKFTFIAYKTNAAMLQALMTGEIHLAISDPAGFDSYMKGKQINVVAATAPSRLRVYPDVPTLIEQDIDLKLETFNGVFAPKGTSKADQDALIAVLKDQVASKEMRDYTLGTAMDDFVVAGDDAKKYMDEMISTWTKLTREAGIEARQ
ncbi:Bug family tripartite tricarboxylate transporter substrate binding protein [Achromobacter piechaudii]|uniref:Uncharacterized protein n=1 Tax=Achromobacter piechaudii TaxID=72556 RepID=A0A6S7DV06_9BURK|nr:tripartite tricarboxylate transporter substrate binding protein [Achromobacter piechaudii]CAB3868367.1 hypothetical protein LMG1861_02631 [Achromobacter piechaudii]